MDIAPITLTGRLVRLEPLSLAHVADLAEAGRDESIWEFMPYGVLRTEEQMVEHVRAALERQAQGTDLPFAVIALESGRAIGGTRYLDIQRPHRALEIGGTWYGTAHQRTGVNTECKWLLLCHAFNVLGCARVQFKTDLRNERSQRAIERIGALREGVIRKHFAMPDGHQRSSVLYSIIAEEWPGVRDRLERLIHGRRAPGAG
jgi:RimJ/RimL family protein N-acetyltransferase